MSDGFSGGGAGGKTTGSRLPRHARGRRPQYFDLAPLDQMHSSILALTQELSVVIDRLDTIERIMDAQGMVRRSDIENYRLTEKVQTERRAKRSLYISRVFRSIEDQRQAIETGEGRASYAESIGEKDVTQE